MLGHLNNKLGEAVLPHFFRIDIMKNVKLIAEAAAEADLDRFEHGNDNGHGR